MARERAPDGRWDDPADADRVATLLDAAQDLGRLCLWERDAVTGGGRWDPRLFRLFGLPMAESPPEFEAVTGLISPSDRARVRDEYQRSLRQPGRHETRYKVERPDGGVTYLHSIWQVPKEGTRVVGVTIDDTDSVMAARRHEVTSTHLALISRLAGVSLWRRDIATQRIFRGDQIWQASGLDQSAEGITVDEFRALIHPDDFEAVDRAYRQELAGQETPAVETRYRSPDGSYRTMLTRRVAQRDDSGQPVAVLGVGIDVSEQVRLRERYRQLLEQFQMMVEATGIGVWSLDLETGERDWNDAMRSLYGFAPRDALPTIDDGMVADAVVDEDRGHLRETIRRALQPDAPKVEVSFRIRRPDGELRAMVGRARRLGQQLRGIVIDVTELQAGQQALRDKLAVEQASRTKSAFLSRMSHELRTPLNAMLGFGALLLDDPVAPPSALQRERLNQVMDAGHHLLSLVNDMLELGEVPTIPRAVANDTTDLSGLIEEVLAGMVDAGRRAGVQISVSGHCPTVQGPETQWRRVVSNLLSNAIKYNRPGGYVQVALSETADPDWALLEVRDSGRGLGPEQQMHLFEPFNRLGAERDGIPGAGLGLLVVRQLVQVIGGEFEIQSEHGVGTAVRVRARRAAGPEGYHGTAFEPTSERTATERPAADASVVDVVYVEDNPVNVLLVREILAQRPHLLLHVAVTVAEAEALVPRVRPALLLVDMHLPDGDGLSLLNRLREGGPVPATHCIALSADVIPEEIARARDSGFDDYWLKPIDVPAFLGAVDRLLPPPG